MIRRRRSGERGHANHGWLDTYHTFSFADYYDPRHMGFRALRVINEDRVRPGGGFPRHGHRDMEIITYVLEGALEHQDSMGNRAVITAGEVQRMTAGTGVLHGEANASSTEPVHFLQIWIVPEREGLEPGYEQRRFATADRRGRLCLVAAPAPADEALTIHQDARLLASLLDPGQSLEHPVPGRHAWVQVVSGALAANGVALGAGDGAAVSEEDRLVLEGHETSELLLFDLA